MSLFDTDISVEKLRGYKKVKIHGMKFVIKRINPLIDFQADKMPQIFTDFISRRKTEYLDKNSQLTIEELTKMQQDTYHVVKAGVVYPELVSIGELDKKGKEEGITVEDLFRDPEIGYSLYTEIINHSLLRFKGLKKLFFSIKIKYLAFMRSRRNMEKLQLN